MSLLTFYLLAAYIAKEQAEEAGEEGTPAEREGRNGMTVLEGISLSFVLLLALYGCAQATIRTVRRILRPQEPGVTLVVTVHERDDAEQQLRFAHWLAREWLIPICVDVCTADREVQHIVSVLSKEKM